MQVSLVMFRADGEKRTFPLTRDITVLGRREDCDLRIPLGDISRKHCRIMRDYDAVRLEDLGSSNGTYCNGVRVQETALEAGDMLNVGPVGFVVQIDGVPSIDDIQMPGGAPGSNETAMSAMMRQPDTTSEDDDPLGVQRPLQDAAVQEDELVEDAFLEDDGVLADDDQQMPSVDAGSEPAAEAANGDVTDFDLVNEDEDQPKQDDEIDMKIDLEEDSKR